MKQQVHYAILKNMQKYIEGFNPDDYISSSSQTDSSVIEYVRDYYDKHLPVDVTAWHLVNEPNKNLIYGKALGNQICFVRDKICSLFYLSYEELCANPLLVISTHSSKSVKLPVYQINLEKYNIEIILRDNFSDWKVSIKSAKPLDFDFMGLFDPAETISHLFCEGFPKNKVFGSYENDHSEFTFELPSNYHLFTFMFLLKNYLGIKKEN